MSIHTPVLLDEVIEGLQIKLGEQYIDATLGAGGHSRAMIEKGALVLGIDQDETILDYVRNQFNHSRLTLVYGNFSNLAGLSQKHGFNQVSGILFDLGVSSLQLDTPARGFSFNKSAPLDMRMDLQQSLTAQDLVNTLPEPQLFSLLVKYSQERKAAPIAAAIVQARQEQPITTTKQLATIIETAYGNRDSAIHPATKTFQALRMEVNQELTRLETGLSQAVSLLKPGGRLAVISFHETEDRLVKQLLKRNVANQLLINLTKKPIMPTPQEVRTNPRSRSAKLRLAEKL